RPDSPPARARGQRRRRRHPACRGRGPGCARGHDRAGGGRRAPGSGSWRAGSPARHGRRDSLMASVARARPLEGRTIVGPRAGPQARNCVTLLPTAGASVLDTPTLAIAPPASWAPRVAALDAASSFRWLIFTSVNGVIMVDRRLPMRRLGWACFAGARVAAI